MRECVRAQSCRTLCGFTDYNLLGSSGVGFSKNTGGGLPFPPPKSSQHRSPEPTTCISCIGRQVIPLAPPLTPSNLIVDGPPQTLCLYFCVDLRCPSFSLGLSPGIPDQSAYLTLPDISPHAWNFSHF